MTEEKNGVNHGPTNSEMAPQEDGTKVPLTDEAGVKYSSRSPSNGDAKIDISSGQAFSGLTKEELMKYADDPFWVRLRWVLFLLFWGGWLAMLVMAIVIIIQAPRCAPKETLEWVQESAMLQYDLKHHPVDANGNGKKDPEDLVKMAASLGIKTVYLENLISSINFEDVNHMYETDKVMAVLEAAKKADLHVVTDFVSSTVRQNNTWFLNRNMSDFFIPGTRDFDFSNQNLLQKLVELFSTTWIERGVHGFLVNNADETLANATDTITKGLEEMDGAVVHGVIDANRQLNDFSPDTFKEFLDNHIDVDDWYYFKFNPSLAETDTSTEGMAGLVTMALFLVPGTPILLGIENKYFMDKKAFIKVLSEFREKESVQIGNMTFVNTTSEDVLAFTRVEKGTPGCAVAVNFHRTNNTEVDFRTISGVPEKGDIHIKLSNGNFSSGDLGRTHLSKVMLQPLEGVVVLFVPDL